MRSDFSLFSTVTGILLVLHLSYFAEQTAAQKFTLSSVQDDYDDSSTEQSDDKNADVMVQSVFGRIDINEKLPQPETSFEYVDGSAAENQPQSKVSFDLISGQSTSIRPSNLDVLSGVKDKSTNGPVPQQKVTINVDEEPIVRKFSSADIYISANDEQNTEKIPQSSDDLDVIDGTSTESPGSQVSYEFNDSLITEKLDPVVSHDVKIESTTESQKPETSSHVDELSISRWVQKIRTNKSRSLAAPAQTLSFGKPVWFGQIITNVLYGPPWSASHTNSKCANDMRIYNTHLKNFTLWAVKMLDAASKGPEGLIDGNTFSFGNFDQCLSTKSKNLGINGGYSLVDIDFRPSFLVYPEIYNGDHSRDYEPLDDEKSAWEAMRHNIQEDYVQRHKFQWAVCLPETCQAEDVKNIISDALVPELNRNGMEGNVTIDPLLHTSSLNTFKYSTGFYFTCAMYLAIAGLVSAGTLYDLIYLQYRPKSEHGPMKKIMKPFSLISNIDRLLKSSETEEFSIMNGFKVLSILQVIIGHRWFIEFGNPQQNPNFVHWIMHNVWLGYFKCVIFLETFFVISGFLTFHLITKHLTEKKRLDFIPIMIYRWLRIFPVYGTLIVTYIFILPYLNDGPYWKFIIYRESERCQANWWTNVLFINNYVNTDELCIIPSWYLACDMHFFIVGTLLTYAIWKWRKFGLILLGMCLTLSTIIPAYIILRDQHRGTSPVTPDTLKDLSKERFYTNVYIKSHMRSMTYFIGILAGYLYMKLKEANYKLSLKSRIFWAPTVLMIGNFIYLSSGIFFALGHGYVAYEHVIYFTFGRLIWSILISYGIIGHGLSGFGVCISDFLGHKVFHVLGKLVFCIYIFQEIVQLQTIAAMKTPTYQSLTLMTWRFFGDTLMAITYAFAINVMVESPCDRLQKNVMKIFIGDTFSKPKPQLDTNNAGEKSEHLTT